LNEKRVTEIMTPLEDVVTLSADQLLDHSLVDTILTSGYSRFPVHEKGKPLSFIGFLLVKRLLLYDPSHPQKVSDFRLTVLPEAKPSISCFQAPDYFQTGRAHLLLVSNTPGVAGGALGVVTLEDIIEEIISEEIVDETDVYEDMQTKRRAKRQGTAAVMRGIVERGERMRRRDSSNSIHHSILGAQSNMGSPPGTPNLSPAVTKIAVVETTRLLEPIDELTNGRNKEGGSSNASIQNSPEITQDKSLSLGGYGTI